MTKLPQRFPANALRPTAYWLLGLAVVCLVAVLGLEMLFDSLRDELGANRANEQARLFIGDDIVRGIRDIETDLYRLAATSSDAEAARVRQAIDRHVVGIERDLHVLVRGGTVERVLPLNLEGHDDMRVTATYRPAGDGGYVMETIEVGPQLATMAELADTLKHLVLRRGDCESRQDFKCLQSLQPELTRFLKQLPSHVERIGENANRLYFSSNQRLRELEDDLGSRQRHLKLVEKTLISLVIVLAGVISVLLVFRLGQINRRLEAALADMAAARAEAEQASRAKSEFVSRMSHELRTPLNAIIGFADLLEAEPLSPSHRNYVSLINSSGRHLMELINAVLDLAKIEAGGLVLEEISFDFAAAIDDVKAIVGERAAGKNLEFVATVSPVLPRRVMGDPTRLRQVLINLLVNAVKFTEQGTVSLRAAPDGGDIQFAVRDSGIGMDEQACRRLFQPFSQGDESITRRYGGTGLGLVISKELIEAMGGDIEVESAPGAGTCFWFRLPLKPAPDVPGMAAAATPAAAVAESALISRIAGRALLVDDNLVNQKVAGAMLAKLGLSYDLAGNGVEAVRCVGNKDYALVLMDVEMPEMDGITATQRIRDREVLEGRARLPIIAMTANALQEDRERCLAAGMDGYVAKPISRKTLQDELNRVFSDQSESPCLAAAPQSKEQAMEERVFDQEAALDMMGGDHDLLKELARMFIDNSPRTLGELNAALAAGDRVALKRSAHTLKGLFATFVCPRGETIARELEQVAGDSGVALERCRELADGVRDRVDALNAALAHYVAG
ncbi:MAG: response regulator [Rhodocyclaceae bacterium]|nr:response regulator [Rhodocyclaceae bacterium]MBK9954918.1 response regulator [Rhodocyclaceae bacterium]